MRNAWCSGALLATALGSAAATATPIGESDSATSVIDAEFWGRQQIVSPNPDDPGNDIISYGDPVHGAFRIWTKDAPPPNLTSYFLDYDDAVVYGRDRTPVGNPSPASFVTSRWLSPLPKGFDGDVSPLPTTVASDGGDADDYVTIGDAVQFRPNELLKDWFQVNDGYTAFLSNPNSERRNALTISVSTPADVIQGLGLNQEFELDVQETGGSSFGFFSNVVERYVVSTYSFVVDRLRVSKHLACRR